MIYEHAHISPVRTEKISGSEFLNLRGAIVKTYAKMIYILVHLEKSSPIYSRL